VFINMPVEGPAEIRQLLAGQSADDDDGRVAAVGTNVQEMPAQHAELGGDSEAVAAAAATTNAALVTENHTEANASISPRTHPLVSALSDLSVVELRAASEPVLEPAAEAAAPDAAPAAPMTAPVIKPAEALQPEDVQVELSGGQNIGVAPAHPTAVLPKRNGCLSCRQRMFVLVPRAELQDKYTQFEGKWENMKKHLQAERLISGGVVEFSLDDKDIKDFPTFEQFCRLDLDARTPPPVACWKNKSVLCIAAIIAVPPAPSCLVGKCQCCCWLQ
jgi:hypothetical protein